MNRTLIAWNVWALTQLVAAITIIIIIIIIIIMLSYRNLRAQ